MVVQVWPPSVLRSSQPQHSRPRLLRLSVKPPRAYSEPLLSEVPSCTSPPQFTNSALVEAW